MGRKPLFRDMAQMVARFLGVEEATGSSPVISTTADSAAISIDTPVQTRRVLSGLAILKPENLVINAPQFRRGRPLLDNKAHPKPASGFVCRYTNQPSKDPQVCG